MDDGQNAMLGAKNRSRKHSRLFKIGTASTAARYQKYVPMSARRLKIKNPLRMFDPNT
jgi:hypothetical protein